MARILVIDDEPSIRTMLQEVLFDRGHVSHPEPFQKLVNQGMILGEPDENGKAEKMSKSRGNVINPDDIVKDYGADSLRLYEMFMGALEAVPSSVRHRGLVPPASRLPRGHR